MPPIVAVCLIPDHFLPLLQIGLKRTGTSARISGRLMMQLVRECINSMPQF